MEMSGDVLQSACLCSSICLSLSRYLFSLSSCSFLSSSIRSSSKRCRSSASFFRSSSFLSSSSRCQTGRRCKTLKNCPSYYTYVACGCDIIHFEERKKRSSAGPSGRERWRYVVEARCTRLSMKFPSQNVHEHARKHVRIKN